jgi:hypothetical protein
VGLVEQVERAFPRVRAFVGSVHHRVGQTRVM